MLPTELYQTSDFKTFTSESKAVEHQIDLLGELLDGFLPYDDRGNVTQTDRFNLLMKQLHDKELFNKIDDLYSVISYMREKRITIDQVNQCEPRY